MHATHTKSVSITRLKENIQQMELLLDMLQKEIEHEDIEETRIINVNENISKIQNILHDLKIELDDTTKKMIDIRNKEKDESCNKNNEREFEVNHINIKYDHCTPEKADQTFLSENIADKINIKCEAQDNVFPIYFNKSNTVNEHTKMNCMTKKSKQASLTDFYSFNKTEVRIPELKTEYAHPNSSVSLKAYYKELELELLNWAFSLYKQEKRIADKKEIFAQTRIIDHKKLFKGSPTWYRKFIKRFKEYIEGSKVIEQYFK